VETVTYKNIGDRIAWIKIGSFSKPTNDQLKEAFAQGRRDGIKSIILDLRDNPGGLLDQSVKVASHFLEKNRLVVYTQGRDKRDRQEFLALYDSALKNIPLVLLINQHSASASEIVAGSLRDSGRAMVIGQNSYGKGSVQTIFRISDGSGLRLTTSKYYTPSGIDISVEKIVPEIKIIPEMLEKKESSLQEESTRPEEKPKRTALITLKESEVKRYLQKKGLVIDRENDPTLLLAHQILMRTNLAGKQHTLAKAREIASRIHF
ncbi:MAG: S41 family peptidase, partial [Nitrospinales bacterium]